MRVFYDGRQNVANNNSFSPSAGKPAQVVGEWKRMKKDGKVNFALTSFEPAEMWEMFLAHDPQYVRGVLSGKHANGFGNTLESVRKALPWVCGSMIRAALHSYQTGETTFSPTSGAHHAGYSHGGGFCTFNFLMMAAISALYEGADRVGIVDMDCHYGNGTVDIINELGLASQVRHYTFGRCIFEDMDTWLEQLPSILDVSFSGVDLLIFNAGVDSHIDDPLGGRLTTAQMAKRDAIVISWASKNKVPLALSLAGGYQKDVDGSIAAVLALHNTTFLTACSMERADTTE